MEEYLEKNYNEEDDIDDDNDGVVGTDGGGPGAGDPEEPYKDDDINYLQLLYRDVEGI